MNMKGFTVEDYVKKELSEKFDYIFWLGDMNYRVNATRQEVDQMIKESQLEVPYPSLFIT